MPLIKQTAYISPSPISIEIGNAITIPTVAVVPSQEIYFDNQPIGGRNGKWIQSFSYYPLFGGGSVFPTSFVFSDLTGVVGDILASLPATTTSVNCPELIYVGGSLASGAGPNGYSALTTLDFPKLKVVGNTLASYSSTNPLLTTFNAPELLFVGTLGGNFTALSSLSLPKLKVVSSMSGGSSLNLNVATSVDLSSVVYIGSALGFTAPNCITLTLPTLGTWKVLNGNFTATSCAFNQTTVDNILASLAYMDGTNGTLVFSSASGRTITITGTSSAPSNAGSTTTPGSNFVGAGTTCTVNLTSHGYATDDVLRISGITTLTNANRYARITVVNANQFTYTITSQTATGAGTATIVKAGASAKALVTRGVTLTTN
jgi:hypothetical protein